MSFEAVLGNKEFEFVVSEMTLTVVTRRSTSGGYGVSVLLLVAVTGSGSDSLEAQTVSLVLIMSSTSLLSGSKNFFLIQRIQVTCTCFHRNPGTYYLELCNIVFRFTNCFPFLIPNELTKYQAT